MECSAIKLFFISFFGVFFFGGNKLFSVIPVFEFLETLLYTRQLLIMLILRYVTHQLFRQFRSDDFLSKLSSIVAVYKQI